VQGVIESLNVDEVLAHRREPAYHCSMAKALEVVSTRSALLLMREAFYGTTRFDDFTARVGISEPVAAARLKELVDHDLLAREPYREQGQRTRYAYRLTEQGADLLPVLAALMQWGDRWLAPDGGPVELRHHGCGARVEAELHCAAGHRVPMDEVDVAQTDEGRRLAAARRAAAQG
jgi:DNA-binding HxlR family transcriptional regulator